MEIEIVENFKFGKVANLAYDLLVESDKISETIEFIKKEKIKSIELNFYHGYLIKNLDFITEVADIIENLSIVTDDIDLKHMESIKNLKKVFIGGENKSKIDFSHFQYLEYCNVSWHNDLKNINACKFLKRLILRKYTYNTKTSQFISGLDHLKNLCFIESKFEDLEMLKSFTQLEELEISYNRTLKNIDGLINCKDTLKKLELENCKNIISWELIKNLKHLEYLGLNDLGKIESLIFIKDLKRLKHLSFVGTDVIDGNLDPCLGIEFVGFNNKKSYNHTFEELNPNWPSA